VKASDSHNLSNSLPPQNIEAEEFILGGILLDPEAIVRVADILVPDAFYILAHKQIYQAALILHAQNKPTDLMTVTICLADRELLEKIGGPPKLAQLLNRTVSAANIEGFARLVMGKYIRRQLIAAGNEIVNLGYDNSQELDVILDESEQKIFALTQKRPQQGFSHLADTLIHTFNEVETLYEDKGSPGVTCDFYDLDGYTSGFGRSDLIILAGRPSMGKCLAKDMEIVLADGEIVTIEEFYQRKQGSLLTLNDSWKFTLTQPSLFVDDGIKPVFRVTTRLGRTIETTIVHPYLTIKGWRKLEELKIGDKIGVPRQINVFGSETLEDSKIKLLAYLIGDGGLTNNNPRFTNSNPLLQTEFCQAVTDFGYLSIRMDDSLGKRTPSFCVRTDSESISIQKKLFAKRLTKIIQSKKISLKNLSERLKVSTSSIYNWQQGKCVPNFLTFQHICEYFQIDSQELIPDGFSSITKSNGNSLTVWLKQLGLWNKNAHSKTIPPIIFKLPKAKVALFLNRLFATDGWATLLAREQCQLGYGTVSERLARQIQHLLLRFGIIASLKKRAIKYKNTRKVAWQLDITDALSIKNFIAEIGIFGKEEALAKISKAISQKKYQTNRDLIPIEIWEELTVAKGNQSWLNLAQRAGIQGYTNIHLSKRSLSRERLFVLATALNNVSLQNLANSDIYWDEIVAIEIIGNKQVYDLTIPKTHNFIANDICVHNTALGLGIATNIAKKHQLPVAIFSLEMSKQQLAMRLLSSESEIDSNRLRSGRISQNEFEPLATAVGNLSDLPLYIDDNASVSVMQMRSQLRRLQSQQSGQLGLVLLDYLQLMEGGGDNRVQELSKITRSLKGLARELNVPIIALSQLSRGVEQRTNKRPMMSDLRESGSIEQDADLILMLYRDSYYNPDSPDRNVAEVLIVKHRNGPTGVVKLLFQAELTKFENLVQNQR
jgi:replicative DNA helicase